MNAFQQPTKVEDRRTRLTTTHQRCAIVKSQCQQAEFAGAHGVRRFELDQPQPDESVKRSRTKPTHAGSELACCGTAATCNANLATSAHAHTPAERTALASASGYDEERRQQQSAEQTAMVSLPSPQQTQAQHLPARLQAAMRLRRSGYSGN